MLKDLGAFILGKDASDRAGIVENAYQVFGEQHGGPDFYAALSAIDIALCDLVGKAIAAPISTLTGNAYGHSFAAYANVWSNRPKSIAALAERAGQFAQDGYPAVKLYPMYHDSDETKAVDLVQAVRAAIGPACEIIVDFWRLRSPQEVLRMARAFDDEHLWIEDPLLLDNLATLAQLNTQIGFSAIAGETESGLNAFKRLMDANAVSALAPDVALCGGITEMRKVADLAEVHDVALIPHCYNGPVAMMATLTSVYGHRNFRFMETFPDLFDDAEKVVSNFNRSAH